MEFHTTFIYAQNQRGECKLLWEYLIGVKFGMNKLWLVLGDFNNVLHSTNRISGNQVTLSEINKFQECLDTCL